MLVHPCHFSGFFIFMEKILCFQKHEVEVILENELFNGGVCKQCNGVIVTERKECLHDIKQIAVIKRNNSIEVRNICIKCMDLISTTKKTNLTTDEFNSLPQKSIEVIENHKGIIFENARNLQKDLIDTLKENRDSLRIAEYNSYLNSRPWKNKREIVLKRDNYICQGCLKNQATEVHHLTYDNIYNELLFQLISVCKPCHNIIHNSND